MTISLCCRLQYLLCVYIEGNVRSSGTVIRDMHSAAGVGVVRCIPASRPLPARSGSAFSKRRVCCQLGCPPSLSAHPFVQITVHFPRS